MVLTHDTWSRYVTNVTWLLSQITWDRDTKFRGAVLPRPGMPLCPEKTHQMNEFSQNSSITCSNNLSSMSRNYFFANDQLPLTSEWHSSGRAESNIKLNGAFCFLNGNLECRHYWRSLSLHWQFTTQQLSSCPLFPIGLTNLGKVFG